MHSWGVGNLVTLEQGELVAIRVWSNGRLRYIDGHSVTLTGAHRLGGCQNCGKEAEQYVTLGLVDGIERRYWWCRSCRCLVRTA